MKEISFNEFPAFPAFKASWAPIYLEPIVKSGERLTIGVAAIGEDGGTSVVPVIRDDVLNCLFGSKAKAFMDMVNICLDSMLDHIVKSHTFANWKPPLMGAYLGQVYPASGDDLTSVLRMAMRMSAFLANIPVDEEDDAEENVDRPKEEINRWVRQIKEFIKIRNAALIKEVNRRVEIIPGAGLTQFGYFGRAYAANFGFLLPLTKKRITNALKDAKAKLWDLEMLREIPDVVYPDRRDLIVWRPRENDPSFSEEQIELLHAGLEELTTEADRKEIRVFPVYGADSAVDRILQRVAA